MKVRIVIEEQEYTFDVERGRPHEMFGASFCTEYDSIAIHYDCRIRYASPENGIADFGDSWVFCPNCKELKHKDDMNPESYIDGAEKRIMKLKGCCFKCAFWYLWKSEKNRGEDYLVIDGRSYHARKWLGNDEKAVSQGLNTGFKGFGGRETFIERLNGDKLRTDDMWTQGEIPGWLNVEDNARFITREEYWRE